MAPGGTAAVQHVLGSPTNYIRFPIPEANRQWIRRTPIFAKPLLNPLGTPSGKIEIFQARWRDGYADCTGHPKWYEPKEWVKSGGGALSACRSTPPRHLTQRCIQPTTPRCGTSSPSPTAKRS